MGMESLSPGPLAGKRYRWCYAWPVSQGESGARTYFVSQTGDILSTEASEYDGDDGPRPGAAIRELGLSRVVGRNASGATGQDGNHRRRVN